MTPVIVLAETFTVICGEHNQEIFVVNRLPDPVEEASDGLVYSSNLGVVAIFLFQLVIVDTDSIGKFFVEPIGRVGFDVVDPHKKRFLGSLLALFAQPIESVIGHVLTGGLAIEDAEPPFSLEALAVGFKVFAEQRQIVFESPGANESGRVPSVFGKDLRQRIQTGLHTEAVARRGVDMRFEPCDHRAHRRTRQWFRRPGALETQPLGDQAIDIG